jgi:glycosyltransferase involved in cell wall biosynthesis
MPDQASTVDHAPALPVSASVSSSEQDAETAVALLTGGRDKPYVLGLATALTSAGVTIEVIGSNELDVAELRRLPKLRFLNLRGAQSSKASFGTKLARLLIYYLRLAHYAATARPKVFHILWNNKLEFFDRTLLMLYYRLLQKKIVLTAHNVNAGKRDLNDSWANRLTLKVQYALTHHILVHTEVMKRELIREFNTSAAKITVMPYGIDNTAPMTDLKVKEARQRLKLADTDRAVLFYGLITPYKGLEYLVTAFAAICQHDRNYRLIIVGQSKHDDRYWHTIEEQIAAYGIGERITRRIEFIPDEEIEIYFKATDVIVLPYTFISQSAVLFLAYAFGVPVIVTDVGSFRDYVVDGKTGFVARPKDSADLASTIRRYFDSNLYRDQVQTRQQIREYANTRYSWHNAAGIIRQTYRNLLDEPRSGLGDPM